MQSRSLKLRRNLLGLVASSTVLNGLTALSQEIPDEQLVAVGWVQAAGEIRIYARKSDLGRLYDGSCISGVLTGGRTMPVELKNRHVSAYGRLVDAKDFDEMKARGISSGVENYCNSAKIAIITRLVESASDK